jgi:biopolymer transport protein TolR
MAFTAPSGRTQTALADINITPLVDVVLVLLIIFMVTAPVLQSGIEVSVPKTRTVKAFATVMDAVKQSGITNVSIVTQPLEENGAKR